MKKIVYILLVLLSYTAYSQSLSLFNVDASTFPSMRVKFYAFDNAGKQILNLAPADVIFTENGQPKNLTFLNCPAPKPPVAISSVLVFDMSISMDWGPPRIQSAKEAAYAWVDGLPVGQSECALVSFASKSYIVQDFTTDKPILKTKINQLITDEGTNYNQALLDAPCGGLQIAKTGKYKRVIILLTDGEPNFEPNTAGIIQFAKQNQITIYAVTLDMPAPQCIKDMTKETGGEYFENITTQKEAEETYKKLLILAQSNEPCEIAWTSDYGCQSGVNNLELKVPALNLSSTASYKKPSDKIAKLELSPAFVMFKNVKPGTTRDTIITVTARNTNFNVTNITSNNPLYDINPKSFSVSKNKSTQITLSYSPTDSSYSNCKFEIETDVCPISLFASAVYSKYKIKPSTLKLTHPNGGEEFVVGVDTNITWVGVSPGDKVKLEYSIDDGLNWQTIIDSTSGLSYTWKSVPKPISNICKIRITECRDVEFGTNDLIIELCGHQSNVNVADWSPDGKRIATASDDNTAMIWDADTGKMLKKLMGHLNAVKYISWSPNGKRVATASNDKTAIIWDADSGEKLFVLTGHDNFLTYVSWSPDGTKIATSGYDNDAIIWDATNGTMLKILVGHGGRIYNVDWSPDGSSIVTASEDTKAIIWDAMTGQNIKNLNGHTNIVNVAKWSPNGKQIATASDDHSAIIWDAITGATIHKLQINSYMVNYVDWSPDGSRLVSASADKTVTIWDASTGAKIRNLFGHIDQVKTVNWSFDGNRLVTAGWDSIAVIWDANTGAIIHTLKGHTSTINSARWSPDCQSIITASPDFSSMIWDAGTGENRHILKGHTAGVYRALWSPDGNMFATSSKDSSIIIWDAKDFTKKHTLLGQNYFVLGIEWSPNSKNIVSYGDSTALIWDVNSGSIKYKLLGHTDFIEQLKWSPDGKYIATASRDSTAILWDVNTGTIRHRLASHKSWVRKLSWSPDGNYIATSGFDDTYKIWDVASGLLVLTKSGFPSGDIEIAWSPDGTRIATYCNGYSNVWDAQTGLEKCKFAGQGLITWSPDSKCLAAHIEWDVIISDATNGKKIKTLYGPEYEMCGISWSPDGSRLAACGQEPSIIVWDYVSGKKIHYYDSFRTANFISWSPDGRQIAGAYYDRTSKIWNAEYPEFSIQQDESDKVFSIVSPNQKIDDLDLKKCLVGKTKDSIITNFITNTGFYKFRVDSIYFTGADAKCFKLVSGKPKYELRPGRNKNAEFGFTPNRVGIHTATLNIKTQSDLLQRTIQGEGVQPKLQLITDFLDFGRIEIGRDTTITDRILVKNVSGTELIVKDVVQLGPDKTQFEILNGGGSFTLQQDESRKLTIRFKPINIGRTSNFLGFEYEGLGSPAKVQLYGEGINNKPKLESNLNNFPDLICQNSAQTDLTIRNIGGKPLIVSSLTIKGLNSQDFSVPGFTGFTLNPNDSKQLAVLFKPKQIGTRYADLEISSDSYPDANISIPISGKKDSLNLSYIESNIDLGFLCPNEIKDTVLTIKNFGSIKTGAYLVGNTNISLNNKELVLQPDESSEVYFTFDGLNSEGNINENITITDSICGISKRIFITGKVALPKIESQDLNIKSELNISAQGVMTIKNIGDRDILINNPPVISPPFKILGNSFPATIKSKDSLKFAVEFLPTDIQDHFAKIYLPIEPCNITKEVNIAGVVSSAKVTINNVNCEAYPGDIIEIPLSLLHATNLQYSGITGLDLDLIYNPTLLSPSNYSGESINNTNSRIYLKNLPITGPDLTKIKFTVGLGNAESCDLILQNVNPIGGTAKIDLENGTFKLLGICREGGTRLFNPTGKAEILSIMPNPASEDIEIKVNLIEDGATLVSVYNSNGMKIQEYNLIGETGQKTINLNAKDFSNGLYFIQLQTPTVLENQKLMIIK